MKKEMWTKDHDKLLVSMSSNDRPGKEIAKALNHQFGSKRTAAQCRSRLWRIRRKIEEVTDKKAIRAKGSHRRVLQRSLTKIHSLSKKRCKQTATETAAQVVQVMGRVLRVVPQKHANGGSYRTTLIKEGEGTVTVTAEGNLAKNPAFRNMVDQLMSEAALISQTRQKAKRDIHDPALR